MWGRWLRSRAARVSQFSAPALAGRPGQKRGALLRAGGPQAPLKELSRHAEGELLLQFRPARPQDLVAPRPGPPASDFHQGRLSETHPALHYKEPARALKQSLDRRQLTLPLQQLHEKQAASYPPMAPPVAVRNPADRGGYLGAVTGRRSWYQDRRFWYV